MRKIIIIICLTFIFIVCLIAGYLKYGLFWKYEQISILINDYLEEKYKDEFLLSDIKFDWKDGGSYFTNAEATSTNAVFFVGVSTDGKFEDYYVPEYWINEGLGMIKPILSNIFNQDYSVSFDLSFRKKISHFKELNENKDFIHWKLEISFLHLLTDEDQSKELERAFQLIEELKNNGFKIDKLDIGYVSKTISINGEDLSQIHQPADLKEYIVISE